MPHELSLKYVDSIVVAPNWHEQKSRKTKVKEESQQNVFLFENKKRRKKFKMSFQQRLKTSKKKKKKEEEKAKFPFFEEASPYSSLFSTFQQALTLH